MRNLLIGIVAAFLTFSSCVSNKNLFQTAKPLDAETYDQFFVVKRPVLKSGDKITLSIWGHNDISIGSVNTNYSSNEATGKWLVIDDNGDVNLPRLGRTNIGGLTIREVNYKLEGLYGEFLKTPIVNVRILNHYVTILGEVKRPGKYNLQNEGLNLIELLGEASGLEDYAKRENVEVIRDINGETYKLAIDLTYVSGLNRNNIELQPDDIVYIPPKRNKRLHRDLQKATPIATFLTGFAVIFSVFFK